MRFLMSSIIFKHTLCLGAYTTLRMREAYLHHCQTGMAWGESDDDEVSKMPTMTTDTYYPLQKFVTQGASIFRTYPYVYG